MISRPNAPVLIILIVLLVAAKAFAEQALVATATNFAEVAAILKSDFESTSHHQVEIASGSTGQLYAQILHGAPYDVLLAADQERPKLLERTSDGVSGTRFVYAIGRLTLWSPQETQVGADAPSMLKSGQFDTLAIANPLLAPYGVAAEETLQSLNLLAALEMKIVMGENIGQTHALIATGNADLGFVSLSTVMSPRNTQPGSRWDVPVDLYRPIRQDALLLRHGSGNAAAKAFLVYLKSESARTTIESFGYGIE